MSSSRIVSDLAAVLVPIGFIGAALAAICAIVLAIAMMRGAGGLSGGAAGLWFGFALVSAVAGFGSQWLPVIGSGAVLIAALVLGGIGRGIVLAGSAGRAARREARQDTAVTAVASTAPTTSTIALRPAAQR